MKKLTLLVLSFFTCSNAFAEVALSEVMQWKFGGGVKTCQENKDSQKMVICGWKLSEPIPSEEEILQYTTEYKTFIKTQKQSRKERKKAVLQKLGLSKEELKGLIEIIQDEDDE